MIKPRKIFLFCCIATLPFSSCKQEEIFVPTVNVSIYDPGIGGSFRKISSSGSSTAFISTSNGKVLRTTDGGTTWTTDSLAASDIDFTTISSPTSQDVYVYGRSTFNTKAFKSTDGGNTWIPLQAFYDYEICDFPTATKGYGISDGQLDKTTNSGGYWTMANSLITVDPVVVAFCSADTGIVVGYDSDVYFTTNGGTDFTQIYFGSSGRKIVYVKFVSGTDGYAVDYGGGIFGTKTSGATWSELSDQSDYGTNAVSANGSTICVVGRQCILVSKDGGASFKSCYNQQGLSIFDNLVDVVMLTPGKAIAIAESGKIYTITL